MRRFDKPILVTRPYFPPIDEFRAGCEEIWKNQWLTNNGPMLQRFHSRLAKYLGVPDGHIALFVNGTIALEAAYQVMGLGGGDVITTPFTFVATSHALRRIGATPVFADIDPDTMCLDPKSVEKLVTRRTKAIVPVHVYGGMCDTEAFDALSRKYGIPVIYDAAHAFGVLNARTNKSGGVGPEWGDVSMFSFHPTKLFHSCEGGLLVFRDPSLQQTLFDLRNFAIKSETECADVGMNGKMNELQALMGSLCLDRIDELLDARKRIYEAYAEEFAARPSALKLVPHSSNKAYVPVLFDSAATRERVYNGLKECNVHPRRYFYPTLTDFAPYCYGRGTCPVADDIASRVLTLPTYHGLPLDDVRAIARNVVELACL